MESVRDGESARDADVLPLTGPGAEQVDRLRVNQPVEAVQRNDCRDQWVYLKPIRTLRGSVQL